MIRAPVLTSLLLLASGPTGTQPVASTPDQREPAFEVTTDSRAYCSTLSQQIGASPTVSREARDLQLEGRTLCSEGQVRGGINRLRRALMVMHAGQDLPQPAPP